MPPNVENTASDTVSIARCAKDAPRSAPSSLLAPFERVRDGAAAVANIPRERRAFLASLFRELAP
jgi:hypothetical protein